MPPGRRKLAEAAPNEYEKERAKNMMRNNQVLKSLGINALTSILNKSSAKSKVSAREDSDSLYEPGYNEDIEQGAVDKVSENLPKKRMTWNVSMPSRGTSGSIEDALVVASSPTPAQPDNQILMSNEGEPNAMIDRWNRGRSMGRDLDRISRGLCTKIPVHIAEGKRRPEIPLQAAKLASEGGIILRQHIPILSHWKEYKKDKSQLADYMGKVAGQFTLDTNSKPVKDACADLLKYGQRQMRYMLKKTYFNGKVANEVRATSPLRSMTDEQWKALVEMWSNPKHKDKCLKNKLNRENVWYQQRTGSRSYIAHCHVVADMEAIIADPAQEGQAPKTHSEVVSQVMPKSKFLQNVGLESAAPKRSGKVAVAARVEELEAELEAEKQDAVDRRDT